VVKPTEVPTRVRFGLFEADLKSGELRRSGTKIRVQGQPFKVLAILLEQAGEVVSREELEQRIWGSDTTVDFDHSLGIAINKLRDALGDSAENPRFIETLARRGYRFIAPVSIEASTSVEPAAIPPPAPEAPQPLVALAEAPEKGTTARPGILWKTATLLLVLALGAWIAAVAFWPEHVKIRRISEITYSGQVLEPSIDVARIPTLATDGARLYFSHVDNGRIVLASALAANGEIQEFKLPSEIASPIISAISPDQGSLILHNASLGDPEQSLWVVPTTGGNARRISGILAHDAVWTPDGKHLVYANGNGLFLAQADGSRPQKFADLPGFGFWLRWSPDGSRLRFSIRDAAHQTISLWELNAKGGDLHPLLPGWSETPSECCGNWTADGKFFVFQSRHGGPSDLWVLDGGKFTGHDPRQLTNGPLDFQSPVGGVQGHRIFFVGSNPSIDLLQLDARAGRFKPIEGTLSLAAMTAYSHDGRWVAWLNRADGSLWRSRIDGSERLQLTSPQVRVFMMRWSPNNKQLAIMAQEPGNPWKIYLLSADGGALEPLLHENTNEADPNWSIDGQTIVFGRLPERMSAEPKLKAIYTVDLKSRQVTEVPNSRGLFSPRLSPDGQFIAAMTLSQKTLMLFDRKTQKWATLTDRAVADPQWGQQAKNLYFQDGLEDGEPIYRLDIATRKIEAVAKLDDLRPLNALDYRLITLAPGDLPVVSASTSNVNLYSINLDE